MDGDRMIVVEGDLEPQLPVGRKLMGKRERLVGGARQGFEDREAGPGKRPKTSVPQVAITMGLTRAPNARDTVPKFSWHFGMPMVAPSWSYRQWWKPQMIGPLPLSLVRSG